MILAGVISSKLQSGTDAAEELKKAVDMLSKAFNHAQAAMVALVHAFLWDSFGL